MTGAAVPRWKIARLFAQVNLRVAVFVVAHTVSSRHQRLAFAVRHGLDRTTTDTLAAQVGGNRIGTTLRQAQIVLVRTGAVGVAFDLHEIGSASCRERVGTYG